MRAALDQLAVQNDQHLVGVADGGEAVCDDKAGAPLREKVLGSNPQDLISIVMFPG